MTLRVLLDENVPVDLGAALANLGHDAMTLPASMRSADDPAVLAFAVQENRRLVTLDNDFGGLVFVQRLPTPPAIILIRLRATQIAMRLSVIVAAMEATADENGAFIVIDGDGIRVRPLPR